MQCNRIVYWQKKRHMPPITEKLVWVVYTLFAPYFRSCIYAQNPRRRDLYPIAKSRTSDNHGSQYTLSACWMANSQMYDVAVAKKPPMRTHPASRAGLSQQTRSLNQLWASRCMHE